VPYSDHNGNYHLGWALVMGVIVLIGLAASVYLIYVLEILKFKTRRADELRQTDPDTSEHEIEEQVRQDIETGEFDRVSG
jgi:UDP-GlcNAc:undecaprenyl-phosphate GlcNAc-1-phosphate transferase